jgi:hypothetical protein
MNDKILYRLTWLAAALSLGHHLDHLIRGNAVGWPVTSQVNAFTASLIVYPTIITGLLAYHAGRVGPGFWALVSGGGAAFVAAVHFGPTAVEPPELILDHYQPLLGWLAFGWLVTFVLDPGRGPSRVANNPGQGSPSSSSRILLTGVPAQIRRPIMATDAPELLWGRKP